MGDTRKAKAQQSRRRGASRSTAEDQRLAELADRIRVSVEDLQNTDALACVEFLAAEIRRELDGWKSLDGRSEPIDEPIGLDGLLRVQYRVRDTVAQYARHFNSELESSPSGGHFAAIASELCERRGLAMPEAETAVRVLHAGAVLVHSREATRAYIDLLPRMMAAVERLVRSAAVTKALEMVQRYTPRDPLTDEAWQFVFPKSAVAKRRREHLKQVEREIRGILADMRGEAGAPNGTRPLKRWEALSILLFAEHCNGGASDYDAAVKVQNDPRIKAHFGATRHPLHKIRRMLERSSALGHSTATLQRLVNE